MLDVGCGYGRLSDTFKNYTGIDFSSEMVKIGNTRYPDKNIREGDINDKVEGQYDIIFEAMCLSSFDLTPQQFKKKFENNARVVICFEPHEFTIFYI